MRHALIVPIALLATACAAADTGDTGESIPWIEGLPAHPCAEGTTCEDGLCWTTLCGGTFVMGSFIGQGDDDEHPQHQVLVPSFQILQTEVTITQYTPCVVEGACRALPESESIPARCNWGEPGYEEHPANCLTWQMAVDFCTWAGGGLPSEALWEYAARSGGQDMEYPWGDAEPSCDLAVINEENCCGTGRTWPVCSKPAGDTEQGLCDMAGNAFEWIQDWYHPDYFGAPRTAAPWEVEVNALRDLRGGGISSDEGYRTRNRTFHDPEFFYSGVGTRCVRELPADGP